MSTVQKNRFLGNICFPVKLSNQIKMQTFLEISADFYIVIIND